MKLTCRIIFLFFAAATALSPKKVSDSIFFCSASSTPAAAPASGLAGIADGDSPISASTAAIALFTACGGDSTSMDDVTPDADYACDADARACFMGESFQCVDGTWKRAESCAYGCDATSGTCNTANTCTDHAHSCSSGDSYVCLNGKLEVEGRCAFGCDDATDQSGGRTKRYAAGSMCHVRCRSGP